MTAKDTKYLTQMKELPPEADEEVEKKTRGQEMSGNQVKLIKNNNEQEVKNDSKEKTEKVKEITSDLESSESRSIFSSKDIILGIVNFISIGLLVFILFQFPKKAEELKDLRTENFLNESSISFEFSEIEKSIEKASGIQKLFLDESGLVNFVNDIEKLKVEGGAVQKVNFASQQAVKDRTGNFGIPIVIELNGSWEVIGKDLEKIDKLPYLARPANISIESSETEEGVLVFKYGLILYVDDKLGQSR